MLFWCVSIPNVTHTSLKVSHAPSWVISPISAQQIWRGGSEWVQLEATLSFVKKRGTFSKNHWFSEQNYFPSSTPRSKRRVVAGRKMAAQVLNNVFELPGTPESPRKGCVPPTNSRENFSELTGWCVEKSWVSGKSHWLFVKYSLDSLYSLDGL